MAKAEFRHKFTRNGQVTVHQRKLDVDANGFVVEPKDGFTADEHVRMMGHVNYEQTARNSRHVLKERKVGLVRQLAMLQVETDRARMTYEQLRSRTDALEIEVIDLEKSEMDEDSSITDSADLEMARLDSVGAKRLRALAKALDVEPDGYGRQALIAAIAAAHAKKKIEKDKAEEAARKKAEDETARKQAEQTKAEQARATAKQPDAKNTK